MGYKYIVNVVGSTDDEVSEYGNYETWLEYWDSNNSSPIPKTCPVKGCNEKIDEDNKIVGAHVYICKLKKEKENDYNIYTDKIYIAPICNSCNLTKIGYDADIGGLQKCNVMQIDEKYLIPHPDYL